jgi:Fic-DOC domain mobile mystery protein B
VNGEYPPGATLLTPAEEEGLIPSHITTRAELNALEQANIVEAETWILKRRKRKTVLDTVFLKKLHQQMFDQVWEWAGTYRKADRNIGVHWPKVSFEVEKLCDDAKFWKQNGVFTPDEIAIRFHHKLVWIHCYPNGNGRHARLATDLLALELSTERFSWGASNLDSAGEARGRYISALKQADENDIRELLAFARS